MLKAMLALARKQRTGQSTLRFFVEALLFDLVADAGVSQGNDHCGRRRNRRVFQRFVLFLLSTSEVLSQEFVSAKAPGPKFVSP